MWKKEPVSKLWTDSRQEMMVVGTQVLAMDVGKHSLILGLWKVEVTELGDGVNVGKGKRDKELLLGFLLSG